MTDDRTPEDATERAILSDPRLTADDRRMLLNLLERALAYNNKRRSKNE